MNITAVTVVAGLGFGEAKNKFSLASRENNLC